MNWHSGALRTAINFVLFQAGWILTVMSAGRGIGWVGPLCAAVAVGTHLALTRRRGAELRLLAGVTLLGLAVDSALGAGGLLHFNTPIEPAWLCPPWLASLWLLFATTLRVSLGWMAGRPWLGALFGAAGGPLSYAAGDRLGALSLTANPWISLGLLMAIWAGLIPLLIRVAHGRRGAPPAQTS